MNINILLKTNRFINNKIFENCLSNDICNQIVNESEKINEWKKCPYKNYQKYINIENGQKIYDLILLNKNKYFNHIKKTYNLDENINLYIQEIFVVKYDTTPDVEVKNINNDNKINELNFILSVQLNNIREFEGGEFMFEIKQRKINKRNVEVHSHKFVDNNNKNITKNINNFLLRTGDMLLYNINRNKIITINPVTKGIKYTLFFLINGIV